MDVPPIMPPAYLPKSSPTSLIRTLYAPTSPDAPLPPPQISLAHSSKPTGSRPSTSPSSDDTAAVSPSRIASHTVAHDRAFSSHPNLATTAGEAAYSSSPTSTILEAGQPTRPPTTAFVSVWFLVCGFVCCLVWLWF